VARNLLTRSAGWLVFVGLGGCLAFTQHDGPWPCTTDADCTGGDICRPLSGNSGAVCAAATACNDPYDCAIGSDLTWQCSNHQCIPPACTKDSDCRGYVCNDSLCATSCTSSAQCAPNYACAGGTCQVAPCTTDSACGAYRCQKSSCAVSCSSDADCTAGNLCNSGQCAPRSCTTGKAGQCDGFACVGGTCTTQCSNAAPCDPGQTCVSSGVFECDASACDGYACRYGSCLASCSGDGDCDALHKCLSGSCVGCSGNPYDCSNQSSCGASGCTSSWYCSGGIIDCNQFYGKGGLCDQITGCSYDVGSTSCNGVAYCTNQGLAGCNADSLDCKSVTECIGTPTPCNQLSLAQCNATTGCSVP
jgi:hypothetical protein